MLPFLADEEVLMMSAPLVQPAAIRRWLSQQGIPHRIKPSGMPLVPRNALDEERSSRPSSIEPDAQSLIAKIRKEAKNVHHGQKTK